MQFGRLALIIIILFILIPIQPVSAENMHFNPEAVANGFDFESSDGSFKLTVSPGEYQEPMDVYLYRLPSSKIAARQGLSVTDEETGQLLGQLMTEEADLEQLINDLYGWDTKEYVDRVLKPLLLAQKAENDYYQSDFMKAVNDEMAGYQAEVEADPAKFSEIASRVNDDSTKFVEGDLGWFSLGDMVPELELALLDLVEGQISPVVETRFGLHLILLQERIINEGGETTFHASHIFKQTPAFSDYLDEAIKKATVVTLIKI